MVYFIFHVVLKIVFFILKDVYNGNENIERALGVVYHAGNLTTNIKNLHIFNFFYL